ncbi:MAG: hypothetical protein AUG48_05610 [Actinobacteria bacterium 13_1_20CM_3_68_9]|nr:MAG: hypothetical protein AUG48_05610 [Actinobacteria bacterium 13_1_20CM_3_68_9]
MLEPSRRGRRLQWLGGDHREPGERHLGRIPAGLDSAGPTSMAAAGGRRATERLHHDHGRPGTSSWTQAKRFGALTDPTLLLRPSG